MFIRNVRLYNKHTTLMYTRSRSRRWGGQESTAADIPHIPSCAHWLTVNVFLIQQIKLKRELTKVMRMFYLFFNGIIWHTVVEEALNHE